MRLSVCEFLNVLEVSQQEPREAAENSWPGENYYGPGGSGNKWCGTTAINGQEGKGTRTKRCVERRSGIIGSGSEKKEESGYTLCRS